MTMPDSELISCLMVTQPTRLDLLQKSFRDFALQSYPNSELVIVHDGGSIFHSALESLPAQYPKVRAAIFKAPDGLSLGALRNFAVERAEGSLICQWDDDDRYHPDRLRVQHEALLRQSGDFCFLVDQLHWFPHSCELFWDSWESEPYPMNFIPGTLMGRKELMPAYPDIRRGEDSELALAALRSGARVARLRMHGWCLTYVYHGANTFNRHHHYTISASKALTSIQMQIQDRLLQEKLAQYSPPYLPSR